MTNAKYIFHETEHDAELSRLRVLESVFDPGTRRALLSAGVRPGMRCLEVGAGAGSIAGWMSDVVGTSGQVTAVDINTRFLTHLTKPNLKVLETSIQTAPLEPSSFDLAHARFVLIHLPDWQAALDAILRLLKPGGRLILEEPDFTPARPLAGPAPLRLAVEHVFRAVEAMFTERKLNFAFGLGLPTIFEERGLEHLVVENDVPIVSGGTPLAQMMKMSTLQLQGKYLATGLASQDDIESYGAFASDASCWAIYHGTVRASASKPHDSVPSVVPVLSDR